jgi:hypothetical protein
MSAPQQVLLAAGFAGEFDYISASTQAIGATIYTFAGVSLGAPDATRRIHVAVGWYGIESVADVTVGGVTAVQNAQALNFTQGTAIFTALVPSGATGDIVVTCTGDQGGLAVGWFRSTRLSSNSALDYFQGTGGGTFADTLTTSAIGFAIGTQQCSGGGDQTWSGIAERYEIFNGDTVSGAGSRTTAASTAITSTGFGSYRAACFASFTP